MEITSEFIHNNKYSLSIRFSSDGFSLYTHDEFGHQISKKTISLPLLSTNEDSITEALEHEVETQLEFKTTQIICESDKYTLIPTDFFQAQTASDYLYFEREKTENELIIINQLPIWESTLIYAIPQCLHNSIKKVYPKIYIEHHLASFLNNMQKDRNVSELTIWIRKKLFDVVYISNGKLTLLNSYAYNTPEDFMFFVLNIFEQLSLNTETCKVNIHNANTNSEIINLLNKYLKEVTVH